MQVADAIRTKRAVRQFDRKPLDAASVQTILNAGRRAQSSKNTQPWAFLAVQDRARLEAMSRLGAYAGHMASAALAVAILTPDPKQRWSILFDAGQAAAYMQLAAWDLGIGSCLATIYEPEAARELLGYPDDLHLHVAISFGYPRDPSELSAPPHPGGRRPLEEVVRYEVWANGA